MRIPFKLIAILLTLFLAACSIAPRPAVLLTVAPSKTETATPAAPTEPVLSEACHFGKLSTQLECSRKVEVTPSPMSTPSPALTTATPTATTPSPTATPTEVAPSPTPIPAPAGEISIGLVGELTSLNPLTDLNSTLQQISPLLYRSLAQVDPNTAQTIPDMAALPAISADGLTLTYTLYAAAPSPADVQASIEAAIWPELDDFRRARQTGSHTLTVELLQPNCALVDSLARLPILFQGDVDADVPEASGTFRWGGTLSPSLTLPLKGGGENNPPPLREGLGEGEISVSASTLRLIANPDYAGDPPQLAAVAIRFFDDEASAWEALQAGEIDVLPLQQKPREAPDGYRIEAYPGSLVTFVAFNNQEAPFDQVAVRQALSHALDRENILQTAFNGEGDLATGMLPSSHRAADPSIAPPNYDPVLAEKMLDETGLRDADGDGWRDLPGAGETWQVAIRANRDNPAERIIALLVADALRQIGVQARAEIVPFFVIIDDLTTHDYQMAVYSLPTPPDLDWRAYWHSEQIEAEFGLNLTAYDNPQVDAWLDEARQVPGCNSAEGIRLYQKIQAQLDQDRPVDFLVRPHYFVALREEMQEQAKSIFTVAPASLQ